MTDTYSHAWGFRGLSEIDLGYFPVPVAFLLSNECTSDSRRKLTPAEFVILLLLFLASAKSYGAAYASTNKLAVRSNLSQRQVFRVLKSLERKQYIMRIKRSTRGAPRTEWYEIGPARSRLPDIARIASSSGITI